MDVEEKFKKPGSRRHPESNEQIVIMDWLRLQYPNLVKYTMHIGNERKSSYFAGYIMKRMGVLKGASDLFIAWPCNGFHGLFLELKTKKRKPTAEQLAFIDRMNNVGYFAKVCYGADDGISTIQNYIKNLKGD